MARPRNASPSYLRHRQSGQARVRINGAEVLLGPYGSKKSWEKYHRLVAENLGREVPDKSEVVVPFGRLTIAELIEKYDQYAESYYVKDGEPTDERYKATVNRDAL